MTERAKLCPSISCPGRWRLASAALLATLLVPTAARAQDDGDPAAGARYRSGPLALTPAVTFTTGLDDNVFYDTTNPRSDMTAEAQPELNAWLRLGSARVRWSGRADLVAFRDYTDQNTAGASQSVRVDVPFNRFRVFAFNSYLHARERPGLDLDLRVTRSENTLGGGVGLRLSTLTRVEISAQDGYVAFDDHATIGTLGIAKALNRHVRQVSATFTYQLTPLTSLTTTAAAERAAFDGDALRTSRSRSALVGLSFRPLALLTGHVDAGVLRFTPTDSRLPSVQAPAFGADVGFTIRGVTHATVRADRTVNYSVDDANAYYLLTGLGVSVTHHLRDGLDVGGVIARQRLEYRGTGSMFTGGLASPAATDAAPTSVALYEGSIGYQIGSGVRLGVHVAYSRRHSGGGPVGSYQDLRAYTSIAYGTAR